MRYLCISQWYIQNDRTEISQLSKYSEYKTLYVLDVYESLSTTSLDISNGFILNTSMNVMVVCPQLYRVYHNVQRLQNLALPPNHFLRFVRLVWFRGYTEFVLLHFVANISNYLGVFLIHVYSLQYNECLYINPFSIIWLTNQSIIFRVVHQHNMSQEWLKDGWGIWR